LVFFALGFSFASGAAAAFRYRVSGALSAPMRPDEVQFP
jgi:hypothetical protein